MICIPCTTTLVSDKEKKACGGKRDATEEAMGGARKKRKSVGMVVYNDNTKVASV